MIVVRDSQIDDAASIARVHVETWRSAYRDILPAPFLRSLDVDQRERGWRAALSNPGNGVATWVAEENDRAVGFATAGPSRDEPDSGELYAIYVVEEYWGKGVGHTLHESVLAHLTPFDSATLWILASNERAKRFYERRLWAPDGATKVDVRPGVELHEERWRRALT